MSDVSDSAPNTPPSDMDVILTNDAQDVYTSDQPISTKENDSFNRWPFATRIADTLAKRKDATSIVIGLYGPWGDGKTSTLRLMEERLQEYPHVVVVRFNPWFFQSEEKLLRGFFTTLAAGLGKSLPSMKENIGELFKKYGALLSLASISIGGVIQIGAGDAAKGLGESLSTIELDEIKKRIEEILIESGKRVVVLIDDIDRLDRNEIHAMFKLVKLSASFFYTSYVLAFDDKMVADAIGEKYGQGGFDAGRAFLEKIIQVPLYLPPPDEISLRTLTLEGVDMALQQTEIRLSQKQEDTFVRYYVDGLEPQLRTPRQSKLYTNALIFSLPLLKGEVDVVDQMLLEGIRVLYPKLYTTIRKYPEYFLKGAEGGHQERGEYRQRIFSIIDASLERVDDKHKEQIKERLLEYMFPRLNTMGYGDDFDREWEKEQRICSEKYFKRYFTYSVPPGDIADLEVSKFLVEIVTMTDDEADEFLKTITNNGQIRQLIRKLRNSEEEIGPGAARPLAKLFARNGEYIPRERAMMMHDWTYKQAAIFVAQLHKRINDVKERSDLANDIINSAQPLPFAFECLRWMRHDEKEDEEKWMFTLDVENVLFNSLAKRIYKKELESPLYITFNRDAPALYWLWDKYYKEESVSSHLQSRFQQNPDEVNDFLDAFVGEAWDMTSGLPHKADFRRDDYNAIEKIVDPSLLASILKQRYGDDFGGPEYYPSNEVDEERRILHQFVYLYNFVVNNEGKDDAATPDGE